MLISNSEDDHMRNVHLHCVCCTLRCQYDSYGEDNLRCSNSPCREQVEGLVVRLHGFFALTLNVGERLACVTVIAGFFL